MNFLENILQRLAQDPKRAVLRELRGGSFTTASAGEMLSSIGTARAFLRSRGLRPGDRCALLAHNSIRWVAMDLAILAEGLIAVPLYARQAPAELAGMMKDCSPALLLCGDAALRDAIASAWPAAPPSFTFDEVFSANPVEARDAPAHPLQDSSPVAIIYTSGTSGEPKGVMLNVGNLNHMVPCTLGRLDLLMGDSQHTDSIFHYLPFCFAGSWILMLTALSRASVLTLSTDLAKLADESRAAQPDY